MATKNYQELDLTVLAGENTKRVVTGSIFSRTAEAKKINKTTNQPISGTDKEGNTKFLYGFFVKQSVSVKEEGIDGYTYKDQADIWVEFWSTEENMQQTVAKILGGKNAGKVTVFCDVEKREVGDKVYTTNKAYAMVPAGSESASYWFNRLITDVKKDSKLDKFDTASSVTEQTKVEEPAKEQVAPVVTAQDDDVPF